MRFPPIAIVGQACTLPDAATPAALWQNIIDGKSAIGPVPAGRWRIEPDAVMGHGPDRTWSAQGGYVRHQVAFAAPPNAPEFHALDPLFQWTLANAHAALLPLRLDAAARARTGLIMGNLSFPSGNMASYAEAVWRNAQATPWHTDAQPLPYDRFNSGLPAHLTARALGLGGPTFALDAACASSLYAIALACARLHDGSADLMVAGAVNRADDLFIHIGFCALKALSVTGQSRPFHRDADGLVPAEGAAMVALRRLDDAVARGEPILGVIRGVGLSNDGRGRGFLAPSEEGQTRAMRQAYELAGLSPSEIGLLECHATGTPVGDATELRSTAAIFAGCQNVAIGSLKSNVGHLITAAGTAGLLKILGAFAHRMKPPTRKPEALTSALAGTPFRVLTEAEPWQGPMRAAISAFGFGGNNAHLIVEGWTGDVNQHAPRTTTLAVPAPHEIAIVAIGARVGHGTCLADFAASLLAAPPEGGATPRAAVRVALPGLKFPPSDLHATSPQQLLVLEAAREACAHLQLPRERTMVLIGMGCDPEIARYGARWRVPQWAATANGGTPADATAVAQAQVAFQTALEAAGVIGTMPNIPANRIGSQLDLAGPGFTISAEEASGLHALNEGIRALRVQRADAALVGAVDVSAEPVHQHALQALGIEAATGDAAVVLVLKRRADAERDGNPVIALLTDEVTFGLPATTLDDDVITPRFGRAHAAHGLLQVAAHAVAQQRAVTLRAKQTAIPALQREARQVTTTVLGVAPAGTAVSPGTVKGHLASGAPSFYVCQGATRTDVLAALAARRFEPASQRGQAAALVLVAHSDTELHARAAHAEAWLTRGGPVPEGVAYADAPLTGELAFVFTGAAAAYRNMGRDLLGALPELGTAVAQRSRQLADAAQWVYAQPDAAPTHPLDQLWGASLLSQVHAELTLRVLALKPHAMIGYSSGESNSLFASGVWRDLDAMIEASRREPLFNRDLVGEFAAVRQARRALGNAAEGWTSFQVAASPEAIRRALRDEPAARLTIINSPRDCVIAGAPAACARVIQALGSDAGAAHAIPLGYEMVAHCPEVEPVRDAWWQMHHRRAFAAPGLRFYSHGKPQAYVPTAETAADAITAQALTTMDFPSLIERAYADGVRIFVEHGPRAQCTGAIKTILGDRPHVAIALDKFGRASTAQLYHAVAEMVAAGLPLTLDALTARLAAAAPARPADAPTLEFACHPAFPRLPALEPRMHVMPRAPRLPSVFIQTDNPIVPAASITMAEPTPRPAAPSLPAPEQTEPAQHVRTTPQAAPVAAAAAPAIALLAAHQARLADLQRQFIATQTHVHGQFLAFAQRAEAAIRQAAATPRSSTGTAPESMGSPSLPGERPTTPAQAPRLARASHPPAFNDHPAPAPNLTTPAPSVPAVVPPQATAALPLPSASAPPQPLVAQPLGSDATLLPGPRFSRAQLEVLASGNISSVFGPAFAGQDGYARQVRMPEPPLLLADRVVGLDAVAHSMGTGTMWTETDVRQDSWYLSPEGRMPTGLLIEAGQADLLLISWLGVDALNQSERVYRLLGCEMTFHGSLPLPGDTLRYAIQIDGHAAQDAVRLFFFHYDCTVSGRKQLTVRHGQAGFFTDTELANSAGVLWDCASETYRDGPLAAPAVRCDKTAFSAAELAAFAAGQPAACFGPAWLPTRAHVRTPRIAAGTMQFLHEVTAFDTRGGPWQRGYLRAETPVTPDDWYFAGHFKNDPCMPGTLMFEGCLQAMAVYLSALGYTIERDGWRFEPVPDEPYLMRCRGQVTPSSKHLSYEVFVSEVHDEPYPTVFADLLCTVDGRKAFHARRVGLRLVPDFPLTHWRQLGPVTTQATGLALPLPSLGGLQHHVEPKPCASVDGFVFDYSSLLACAWGKPSEAFGPFYREFDDTRRVARLPGPPYHFISRIAALEGPMGGMQVGTAVECEYDVPAAAWYFEQNPSGVMPFCVLMEAALQPCGWLASYVGCALASKTDLLFRNLDGTGTLAADIWPGAGTLRTRATLTSLSQSAGMIIVGFDVTCTLNATPVYAMKTVFGYFPKEAFDNQAGLPVADTDRALHDAPPTPAPPLAAAHNSLRLPGPMLCMLDEITGYWPEGGPHGLGAMRAQKLVNPDEWFFKAHFFQDPVQPGSLGIEALCQLLQAFMLARGLGRNLVQPRFEAVLTQHAVTWKYRGQVVPRNERIVSTIELTNIDEHAADGPTVMANASLWVDGKRIYHVKNLGMRIRSGEPPRGRLPNDTRPEESATQALPTAVTQGSDGASAPGPAPATAMRSGHTSAASQGEARLDLRHAPWLADHCPTWTLPALPMMSMVDQMVTAVEQQCGMTVTELRDVRVHRWLAVPPEGVTLRLQVSPHHEGYAATLEAWREAPKANLSRYEAVASAVLTTGPRQPAPRRFTAFKQTEAVPVPYATGQLFHGPAFQYLRELQLGPAGSTAIVDAGAGSVPYGAIHQGLFDAATHGIIHDELHRWDARIAPDRVAYPYQLEHLRRYAPLPSSGNLTIETRYLGIDDELRFPRFAVQIVDGDTVLADFRLIEILLPKGPLGMAPPAARLAFLRDRQYVPALTLSHTHGTSTVLTDATLRESDWLPGTMVTLFAVPVEQALLPSVAAKEHVARLAQLHPAHVALTTTSDATAITAIAANAPLTRHALRVTHERGKAVVQSALPPTLDLTPVRRYWRERIGIGHWLIEDLYYGLVEQFVSGVHLADAADFASLRGRSCLFVANHQVGVESLLFSLLASALTETPTLTLAKAEHRTSWLGTLIATAFRHPGVVDPKVIAFFEREDRESLAGIVRDLGAEMHAGAKNVMVHVEGTRALAARSPVSKMSSAFIDMALAVGVPIVPVRFVGGLPVEPVATRLEFPVGMGAQAYWIGKALRPEHLAQLPYKDRKAAVLAALNQLGPSLTDELPSAAAPAFAAAAMAWQQNHQLTPENATLLAALAQTKTPCATSKRLLAAARTGELTIGAEPQEQWLGRLALRFLPTVHGLKDTLA